MLVSLYTVRVILETLGVEDYGIYNVVAGMVTMFGFLSSLMATANQRYFAFEIGRGDYEQLKRLFGLSMVIYVIIGILVLILAETAGLWFVCNKLIIPLDRKNTGIWVYHFSVASFLFTILTAPYMAMIIAHEDMIIYAYMSIVEVLLKLLIVFALYFFISDKLQLYGILMCAVAMVNAVLYLIICRIKYKECQIGFYWNKGLFKEVSIYMAWNLFGAIAGVFKHQIINIILNQFFNPIVITSRSIALSINNAISSFSYNFSSAIRPQIIKTYAAGQKTEMIHIIYLGAKGTYFLMYIFAFPVILEMPFVLLLWLKNIPEYVVVFTRLSLIDFLIDTISSTLITSAQATGKIKLYQFVVGGILLLNLPISWIVLVIGAPPYSVMIVGICLTFMALIFRLLIMRRLIDFSIIQFLKEVLSPICKVSVLSMVLPIIIYINLRQSIFRLFLVSGVSVLSICGNVYFLGLNNIERARIVAVIRNKLGSILK
jgi:O-antigen/teichoic acid export membrane protein